MKDAVRVATLTMSDTRTHADDESGRILGDLLRQAGFLVVFHDVLREEPGLLKSKVLELCQREDVGAVIVNGGTGISLRDRTIETLVPLFEKTLDGFGEAFRRLSFDQIGANAILSRATAGTVNQRVVMALPGSPKAVRLAVEELIAKILPHAVALASGKGAHHHHHHPPNEPSTKKANPS